MGPLCPTCQSELIARTHILSLYMGVSCERESQWRRFEGAEIVLLPPRLHANVKKGFTVPILGGVVIVEASGDAQPGPEFPCRGRWWECGA